MQRLQDILECTEDGEAMKTWWKYYRDSYPRTKAEWVTFAICFVVGMTLWAIFDMTK